MWRSRGRILATVGEKFRPGIEPEHADDGTEFAVIWLPAATETEVAAFVSGIGAGEALVRMR